MVLALAAATAAGLGAAHRQGIRSLVAVSSHPDAAKPTLKRVQH